KMNVVDLAQSGERAASGESKCQRLAGWSVRAHHRAKPQQVCAFRGARACDPGANGIDEVQLDEVAQRIGGLAAFRDISAELFEGGHVIDLNAVRTAGVA